MIAHQIGVVLCRVGAAILTVQAIRSLGYSLPGLFLNEQQFLPEMLVFSLMGIVPGLAAIGLWVLADRISTVPDQGEAMETQANTSSFDILRIGMTLLGIYLLIMGLIEAARIEAVQFALRDMDIDHRSMMHAQSAQTFGERTSYVLQLLFGSALILGRDRFSMFFVKAKNAGVDTR
ncbi:MAG: hypothetical protein ACR2QS_05300 [Woeseiaceae bacterium]